MLQAQLAEPELKRPARRPEAAPPAPEPAWQPAAPPGQLFRRFLARAFRPGAQLWRQTADGRCRRLYLHKLTQRRAWTGYGQRLVWVMEERRPYPGEPGPRVDCFCRRQLLFDEPVALLGLSGEMSCECQNSLGVAGGGGSSGGSLLQLVALTEDQALLVRGSDYQRYAPEDTSAIYFSRVACAAGQEPIGFSLD